MNLIQHVRRHRSRYVLTLICSMVIILSVRGIVDEGIISMNGDMPRHLMNGVFFYDFVRDSAFAHPQEYAYQYFARYPALSLGHHPLLLAIAEAPFYALFGISVFSARMSIVFFMLLASISWFLLVRSIYDETIASYATFLFITTPFIVEFSQLVMTEIPTIALIILTVFFLHKYCETEEKKYAYAFAISLCLSVYSKHIAVFLFPVSLFYLIIKKGPRGLVHREILYISVMIVTLLTPLLLITLKFSHHSIEYVSKAATIKPKADKLSFYANALWKYHITLPVLILSIISFLLSVFRRDKRVIIFVLWMVCLFVMDTYIGWKVPRYGIYWIPVYCLFASTIFIIFDSRFWKIFVSVILIIVAGYQFIVSYQKRLEFAYGYEGAAKYVVDHSTGGNIRIAV
jgi:4-amino-4-deoxy-L-arabinose transferase-like glycosyltransferase